MEFVCESTSVREFDTAATSRAIAAVLSGQSDGCIIQGDCLRVLPLIPGGSIPMIFTDPPYGHNNAQNDLIARRHLATGRGKPTLQRPIANDGPDSMRRVVGGMLDEAARLLSLDASCCCCCCGGGGPSPTFAWLAQRMDTQGLAFCHSCVWDKLTGLGWRFRRQHEMVMVAHRSGGRLRWSAPHGIPNVFRKSAPRNRRHPNEKPIELCQYFIAAASHEGDVILDPFAGSGTTCLAARSLGRRYIGIELDGEYCNTAAERLTAATASRATVKARPSAPEAAGSMSARPQAARRKQGRPPGPPRS